MPFLRVLGLRRRAHALSVASAIALASWPTPPVHAAAEGNQVLGQWRLTAALDMAEVAELTEREARQLVGQVLTISLEKVQLGKRACPPPSLLATRVEPVKYLRDAVEAEATKLGLPNPVTVVELGCAVVFIKNPNRLVLHWKGWFFDALKVH